MGRFSASLIARWRIYQLCGGVPTSEGAGAERPHKGCRPSVSQ